eukprot:XP_001698814.1 predicted protein [Chlamydomonas reinhardtii]
MAFAARAESVASSGAGPGLPDLPIKTGLLGDNENQGEDDLLQGSSLEGGIFGVLFTLSQEKNTTHIRYQWILLKILLDAWQLFTTILNPEMGWAINTDGLGWKAVSVLSFGWLADLGYAWYLGVLYTMAGLLAANLALCVWVAWSFKEQKFDYVWPIKVVRTFSYVFLQVFDITSLNFLQLGISCNYLGPTSPRLHMDLFPEYSCSETPQIVQVIVSGILLLVEVNPTSKSPQALGHSGAEVRAFGIKALMTLVGVFLGYPKLAAAAYLALATPHLVEWVNYLKGGVAVAMVGVAGLQVGVVATTNAQVRQALTTAMAISLGPLFLLGAAATWARTRYFTRAVLKAFDCAIASGDETALAWGWAFVIGAAGSGVVGERNGSAAAVAPHRPRLPSSPALTLDACCPQPASPPRLHHQLRHRIRRRDSTGVGLGVCDWCRGCAIASGDETALAWAWAYVIGAAGGGVVGERNTNEQLRELASCAPRVRACMRVAARSARKWADLYTLDKAAVRRAEEIIKAGSALFPDSAYIALLHANFMLDALGFSQTGAKQLEVARKMNPGLLCRFILFVRQQQATQKAASSTVGKGGSMDLLGYVEYQRKQRMVLRHHKDALQAMANFWRILGSNTVSFSSLSKSLEEIDSSVSQAETAYRVVLELYNNSPRLVRLYARFLETIKQDPWGAAEYSAAADRLEQNKDEEGQGPTLPDGGSFLDGGRVDTSPNYDKLGVTFMIRRYIDSGDKALPYFKHPVLGMHRERVCFTVRISVSRASGMGEDSVFIGLLEPVPTETGCGRVWVTAEGIIVCCDPGFVTCFGYRPDDVIGSQLEALIRSGVMAVGGVSSTGLAAGGDGARCPVVHGRGPPGSGDDTGSGEEEPPEGIAGAFTSQGGGGGGLGGGGGRRRSLDVWAASKANQDNHELVQSLPAADSPRALRVATQTDKTKSTIYEVQIKLMSDEPQLLMVVERKVMLELTSEAPQRSLEEFLPAPWRHMHQKWLKASGSRSLALGPTMKLVGTHGRPVFVHVGVVSREVSGGGDALHVVRMSRSSLETAMAERRVRMRLSEKGQVLALVDSEGREVMVADDDEDEQDGVRCTNTGSKQPRRRGAEAAWSTAVTDLFEFPSEQLLGCRIWDFLSLPNTRGGSTGAHNAASSGANAAAGVAPGNGHNHEIYHSSSSLLKRDLLTEASEIMSSGGGRGFGGGTGGADVGGALSFRDSMQTPGISWRCDILPPSAAIEAAAMGNPARAAALLMRRTKQAVLRLVIHAEVWAAKAVTGVLELDGQGRVSSVSEEDLRPAGLLFGLPREELIGASLGQLLRLGAGQSAPGLLTDSGVVKKSNLKSDNQRTAPKDKGSNIKVGPVHKMEGCHRDNKPMGLAVQVVGKPGPGNPLTMVLRLLPGPPVARMPPPAAPMPRVSMANSGIVAAPGGEAAGGGCIKSRIGLLEEATTNARGGLGAGGVGGESARVRAALQKLPRGDEDDKDEDDEDQPTRGLAAGGGKGGKGPSKFSALALKGALDGGPANGSLRVRTPDKDSGGLPASNSLGASVACVIHGTRGSPPAGGGRPGAAKGHHADASHAELVPGAAGAEEEGAEGRISGNGSGSGGSSATPPKPASPPTAGHSRLAAASAAVRSPRAGAALDGGSAAAVNTAEEEGSGEDVLPGEKLDAASVSSEEEDTHDAADPAKAQQRGLEAINKWVVTNGEFYQNKTQSVAGTSHADANTPADFKRGKRYRKLVKLMDSPQAQSAVNTFKTYSGLTVLIAGAIHVVCFALIITAIQKQEHAMTDMHEAGGSQRFLQRALVSVRALDNAYKGLGNNLTYNSSHVEFFANDIISYATQYRDANSQVLMSAPNSNIEKLYYNKEVPVWYGTDPATGLWYQANMTLWDLVTRVYTSAKDIYQNHMQWNATSITDVAGSEPGSFLMRSGQELIGSTREVLDALLDDAVHHTNLVNLLQLLFLLIEGCLVSSCVALALMYLLRMACDQRYKLYETFLTIPVGLTRALASQTTHLLDNDESDDELDDETGSHHEGEDAGNSTLVAGEKGAAGGGKTGGGKRKAVFDAPDSDKAGNKGGKGSVDMPLSPTHTKVHVIGGGGGDDVGGVDPGQHVGLLARISSKIWRSNAVHPANSGAAAALAAANAPTRRALKRNSRVIYGMWAIVLCYSFLIILFYSISYALLLSVQSLVAMQAVSDHAVERGYRAVFYTQELVSETNVAMIPDRAAQLENATAALKDAYYTLRMGNQAYQVLGSGAEQFPKVSGGGLSKESPAMFRLFYNDGDCLRLPEHQPCPDSAWRFFQITRTGVDGMMTRLLKELTWLAGEARVAAAGGSAVVGALPDLLASPRWDFIYNVGTMDLNDGLMQVEDTHLENVERVMGVLVVLHVVLFLLLVAVFGCFLLLLFLPLLNRMNKEKRRIAEMMSQLPNELDVMRLVSHALVGAAATDKNMPGGAGRKGHRRAIEVPRRGAAEAARLLGAVVPAAAGGAGTAGANPNSTGGNIPQVAGEGAAPGEAAVNGGSKAYNSWKEILNRATSVNAAANAAGSTAGQLPVSASARHLSGKLG